MESIWNQVKQTLRDHVPEQSFRLWIEPLELKENQEGNTVLICPNFFSKRRVKENYSSLISAELSRVTGQQCELAIDIASSDSRAAKKSTRPKNNDSQLPLPNIPSCHYNGRMLQKDYTFERFVVGGNNDFAYSAALSLASGRSTSQHSLFLLSDTGMGKSHLSQAVGHHILSESPKERVYYMTAEDFTNEMVHSFRNNTIEQFKGKYRNQCDVLLLEDVQYLSGKERTQIELALTLDTLYESGKKIIFSSSYLPADIPKINDKLRSRLSSGLVSNIDAPNFRTRVRILQNKAKKNGCYMPEDVIHYLAGELSENVRQLESGLIGVVSKSSLLGTPINISLAQSVVKNIVRQSKTISIDIIKKMVSKYFNITVADIVSKSRKQNIVRPRQMAMFLSRRYTDQPLQTIGKSFNRYHATALHSIGAVERDMKQSSIIKKQVEFFSQKLETGKF
ncbi:MAG: chromosomal replication initiator protein DnaA [Desulfobacterales bacterium]|nr:chromosomal replication initiator protein DnaA [Desulfobacterales bacterium]